MLDVLLGVAGVLLVFAVLHGHTLLWHAVVRQRDQARAPLRWPSVSVIRPIRGVDVGLRDNLAAALATGYPGHVETIFVLDEDSDPARQLVEEAVAAHDGHARLLYAGPPPPGRTGKLSAMMAGMSVARGDLVAFGDSDTRPEPGALSEVVARLLASPGAGSAFAPVAVTTPPRTLGDCGYALLLNGLYGPAAALASGRSGDLPFIMGQLMVFRRSALDAVGGLDCATGQLVDDMHIGARLSEAGYRNVVASHRLAIVQEGMRLGEFLRTYRRWLLFARSGLPWWTFNRPAWARGVELFLGLALVVLALAVGHPALAVAPLAALGVLDWSVVRVHRAVGGAPLRLRHRWVPLGLLFAGVFVLLATWLWPEVTWRGREYSLGHDARLARARSRHWLGLLAAAVVLGGGAGAVAAPPPAIDVEALVARGNDLLESNRQSSREAGAKRLLEAWKLAPDRFETLVGAARAEFMRSGWARDSKQAARAARHGWALGKRLVSRWPDRAEGYYWTALNIGRYASASGVLAAIEQGLAAKLEAMALKSIASDRTLYRMGAQRVLGCYYLRAPWPLHDLAKARAYLQEAYQGDPDDAPGLLCLADAVAEAGEKARAAELYTRCGRLRGRDPDASTECRQRLEP